MYQIKIVDKLDQLNTAQWDDLAKGHPFCSHQWLQLAKTILADQPMHYIQIFQEGRLEAVAVGTIQDQFPLSAYIPNRLMKALADFLLKHFRPITCEIPIMGKPGFFCRKGSDSNRLLSILLEAMHDQIRRDRAFFLWFPHLRAHDHFLPILFRQGYLLINMLPDSELKIDWPDYESYLTSRPYKKRKDLRRAHRRVQEAGIKIETHCLTADSEPVLDNLVRAVLEHFKQPYPFVASFFSKARYILGEDLTILIARQHGHIIVCGALLRDGEECLLKWLGLDYSVTRNTYTYHVLLEEAVAEAMALGIRTLNTGSGVYEIKKVIGVSLEERFLAIGMRRSFAKPMVGFVLSLLGKRRHVLG